MKIHSHPFRFERSILAVLFASLWSMTISSAAEYQSRVWTDQQGRAIKATFIEVKGQTVMLKLEDGTPSAVPIAKLSNPDQLFVQQLDKTARTPLPAASPTTPAGPSGPLIWPGSVVINPDALTIQMGRAHFSPEFATLFCQFRRI